MSAPNSASESLFPLTYPEYVYNFAYGSNMDPGVLTKRRKIQPIESIPGVLEGWQLTFDLRGIPGLEPCFGNIKENPTSEIHGILHKMTAAQFKHLLATEGGSGVDQNGYIPYRVHVHAYDGRTIEAYALVVLQTSPVILSHHAIPSARYLGLLRRGAAHHQIHPLYIEYLQSLPCVERNKPVAILVIIEILLLTLFFSPFWIPVVIYYMCTQQKAQARAFFFALIMVNLWRIYRLCGAKNIVQPYFSASFPIGSTNFKANTKTFRTDVEHNEQTLPDTLSNIPSSSVVRDYPLKTNEKSTEVLQRQHTE